jgi:hypothetical protein
MMAAAMILVAAAHTAVRPTTVPAATLTTSGKVQIRLPSSVLDHREVRKQLTSGLTTAFVLTCSERGMKGALRVEVRYEVWDETFLVSTLEADGRKQEATLPSYDRLVEWWTQTALRLGAAEGTTAPASLRVTLEVLPFSASEEADTERWLSRSAGAAPQVPTGGGSTHAPEPSASAGGLLDLIIGTSVRRRPMLSFRWTVPLQKEPVKEQPP